MTNANGNTLPLPAIRSAADADSGGGTAPRAPRPWPMPLLCRSFLCALMAVLSCVTGAASAQNPGAGSIANATFTSAIVRGLYSVLPLPREIERDGIIA